jgi:hypothetical protein
MKVIRRHTGLVQRSEVLRRLSEGLELGGEEPVVREGRGCEHRARDGTLRQGRRLTAASVPGTDDHDVVVRPHLR